MVPEIVHGSTMWKASAFPAVLSLSLGPKTGHLKQETRVSLLEKHDGCRSIETPLHFRWVFFCK